MVIIDIGTLAGGGRLTIDIDEILSGGVLIQANSGGGKSYLLRLLAERLSAHVQVLLIDPEGEFASIREHFPFLLVGKGGELPADATRAGAIARKLLQLGVSAVVDLYDLPDIQRHLFVQGFVGGLVEAPRDLWHPVVVGIDEAQLFAPEKGESESPALDAVSALATRGRKRGQRSILATQRLSGLRKTVAAEHRNVVVGPTFLPADVDRAAALMGVTRADRTAFGLELRTMKPGRFFALGRGLTMERRQVMVDEATSRHPQPGKVEHLAAPPAPTEIRKLLGKLTDLPRDAEAADAGAPALRAEVERLRAELAARPAAAAPPPERVEVRVPVVFSEDLDEAQTFFADALTKLEMVRDEIRRAAEPILEGAALPAPRDVPVNPFHRSIPVPRSVVAARSNGAAPDDIGKAGRLILSALAARHPHPLTKAQVATLAGYAPGGGGFNNAIGALKGRGLIERDGESFALTQAGLSAAPAGERPKTSRELVDLWCSKLPGRAKDMLRTIAGRRAPMSKEEIAVAVDMDPLGGGFNNYMGALRSNGLIQKTRGGFEAAASLRTP